MSDAQQAILVPKGGFYQATGGNYIFVWNENQTRALRQNIRIGRHNPKYYEVLEGLQPGQKVIVSSYEGYERIDELVRK